MDKPTTKWLALIGYAIYIGFVMPKMANVNSNIIVIASVVVAILGAVLQWRVYKEEWKEFYTGIRAQMPVVIVFVLLALQGCACERVDQGYTGLLVDLIGSEAGHVTEMSPQRVWYNPVNQNLYLWPNFIQRVAWTANPAEGSPNDESVRVLSKDQLEFTNDISFSYYISKEPGCATAIFRLYRTDVQTITNGALRDIVRKEMQDAFSQYPAEEIYGDQRPVVVSAVEEGITRRLSRISDDAGNPCFIMEDFAILELGTPDEVRQAANRKIAAAQRAQEEGENLQRIIFLSQQDSVKTVMDARNNDIISRSITPELLEWKRLEILGAKWDGKYPQVVGSSSLMLSLPTN